jgi:transposase
VSQLPDLNSLSQAEKDALTLALWQRLEAAERRIADLEARLGGPAKPDNSSLPPSMGQKPNQPQKAQRAGPRQGSLGRERCCLSLPQTGFRPRTTDEIAEVNFVAL